MNLKLNDCASKLEKYPHLDTRVNTIANNFLSFRGQNSASKSLDKKLSLIKKYIYNEIPVLVCGIFCDNQWHRLLYYSGTSEHLSRFVLNKDSLHNLILDIKLNPEFSDVKQMIVQEMKLPDISVCGFIGINIDPKKIDK